MRDGFSRGSYGRGSRMPRGSFHKAVSGGAISIAAQVKIIRAAELVSVRVERHHAKNRDKWIARRYGELLSKPGPTPLGLSNDPQAQMMSRARADVADKRTRRLVQVDRAMSNMLRSGNIRVTRKMDWGKGLGD